MSNRISAHSAQPLPPKPVAPTPASQEAPPAKGPVVAGDKFVRVGTFAHADGQLKATDGKGIAYRTTEPAQPPKAIVVMQQGTLGTPGYFDAMGEQLAAAGIKSYAVGTRVEAPSYLQHAEDLDAVVKRAQQENPGSPVTVMGVSLGGMIALEWSARFNQKDMPVVAMSPVVAPRFLGIRDLAVIGAGMFSDRAANTLVNTPMSAGVRLTTNPDSPEANLKNPETMKVPARLFGDVTKMTADIITRGHEMNGPLLVALAGEDKVAFNGATKAFTQAIRSSDKAIQTFPGTAHDLSQETNHPEFVNAISDWILKQK